MAVLQRTLWLAARRNISSTSTSRFWWRKEKDEDYMADPLEHATGLERKELIAKLQGNDDPWDMKLELSGAGTKEKPNIVYAANPERIVGCICNEDQAHIKWMILREDEMRRCSCGFWFKLVPKAPFN